MSEQTVVLRRIISSERNILLLDISFADKRKVYHVIHIMPRTAF